MNSNVKLQTTQIKVDELKGNVLNKNLVDATSQESLDILSESMNTIGLIEPITVYKIDNGYKIVSGHKRAKCAKRLGWKLIPAVVVDKPDNQSDEAEIICQANIYRKSPEELEAMCQQAEQVWNNMPKKKQQAYREKYLNRFKAFYKENRNFKLNEEKFIQDNFRPSKDFIREMTGLSSSNRTITNFLKTNEDNVDGEEAKATKKTSKAKKKVTSEDVLKKMGNTLESFEKYQEDNTLNKDVVDLMNSIRNSMAKLAKLLDQEE